MARAFYVDVAEALRGFLPRTLRDFSSTTGGHNLKVWFETWHEHYEVQMIGPAALATAGFKRAARALEIGFHAEHPQAPKNDELVERLRAAERSWRRKLGKDPSLGPFIGRREQAQRWRRCSELWDGPNLQTGEAGIEAAERLATYIVALEPVRRAH